jgi:riboflavin-specific deaminase-like protein
MRVIDHVDVAKRDVKDDRPGVTLSYAQTLDGRLATSTGSSQWISAPESLRFSHELRAEHDAIMVGAGTVWKDDPRLTVRLVAGQNPLRVVVDSTLRTPLSAAALMGEAAQGTVFAVTDRAPAAKRDKVRALGATVLSVPAQSGGRVDLVALLAALHERGIRSLLVEGGAELITALLRARLVDRLVVCVAPKILRGRNRGRGRSRHPRACPSLDHDRHVHRPMRRRPDPRQPGRVSGHSGDDP